MGLDEGLRVHGGSDSGSQSLGVGGGRLLGSKTRSVVVSVWFGSLVVADYTLFRRLLGTVTFLDLVRNWPCLMLNRVFSCVQTILKRLFRTCLRILISFTLQVLLNIGFHINVWLLNVLIILRINKHLLSWRVLTHYYWRIMIILDLWLIFIFFIKLRLWIINTVRYHFIWLLRKTILIWLPCNPPSHAICQVLRVILIDYIFVIILLVVMLSCHYMRLH